MKQVLLIQKLNKKWRWPADDPPDPIDLENRKLFVASGNSNRIATNGWWIAIYPDCITLCKR